MSADQVNATSVQITIRDIPTLGYFKLPGKVRKVICFGRTTKDWVVTPASHYEPEK